MPRGRRKKLIETTNLPIINSEEEIGAIPFFILEDNKYGVYTDKISYSLVKRKKISKTIKSYDGEGDYVKTYYAWESFKWSRTFEGIIDIYIDHKTKELDSSLIKECSIEKLNDNRNTVFEILKQAFSHIGKNKEVFEFSDILEQKDKIFKDLNEIEECKKRLLDIINEMDKMLKSKKKLADVSKIIDNHKK